jgi:membrane protease YdiL (CAAX protease family)
MASLFYDRSTGRLGAFLRGHLWQFDKSDRPTYSSSAGVRLLLLFAFLEFVVGPRASILSWLHVSAPPAWLRIALMLAFASIAAVILARVRPRDIGFLPVSKWTLAEALYFAQAPLVIAVFVILQWARLHLSEGLSAGWAVLGTVAGTQLLWGLYQEVVYRGILQTELTRRWGRFAGPMIANIAFTFGPLHFYHLQRAYRLHTAAAWTNSGIIVGAVFVTGLCFAYIFHRTRNIWLVGVLHGIGDMFIEGPEMIAQLWH